MEKNNDFGEIFHQNISSKSFVMKEYKTSCIIWGPCARSFWVLAKKPLTGLSNFISLVHRNNLKKDFVWKFLIIFIDFRPWGVIYQILTDTFVTDCRNCIVRLQRKLFIKVFCEKEKVTFQLWAIGFQQICQKIYSPCPGKYFRIKSKCRREFYFLLSFSDLQLKVSGF